MYGPPSNEEEQQIRNSLSMYLTDAAVDQMLSENQLVIGKGRRHEVFLISASLWEIFQKVQPQHPYFLGIFLGELKEKSLQPSLHFLHRLSNDPRPSAKVIVLPKGEQQFLYGHSLGEDEFQGEVLEESKKVVVMNGQEEGLGYGQLVKTATGKLRLKNRLDLGWYLRRGR